MSGPRTRHVGVASPNRRHLTAAILAESFGDFVSRPATNAKTATHLFIVSFS
jgi:hypothetical protein